MSQPKKIPLNECVHRGVYRIFSRNLGVGVYDETRQGFMGIRVKFDRPYLFMEYHWDTGAPFGTVHPWELIEMLPEEIPLDEGSDPLFAYLETLEGKGPPTENHQ